MDSAGPWRSQWGRKIRKPVSPGVLRPAVQLGLAGDGRSEPQFPPLTNSQSVRRIEQGRNDSARDGI